MILKRYIQSLCHGIQLEVIKLRQKDSCKSYRIHHGKITRYGQRLGLLRYEADIKSRVMRSQNTSAAEFQEFRKSLLNRTRPHNLFVRNSRQLHNLRRNRDLRINECAEPVRDLAVHDLNRADFDDMILYRTESGCFDIEHHTGSIQGLPLISRYNILHVVHQVSFHSVDDLEFLRPLLHLFVILIILRINRVRRVREGLHHSVIRDGNRLMPPFERSFDQGLRIDHRIHIAHHRMSMKLNSLVLAAIRPPDREIAD